MKRRHGFMIADVIIALSVVLTLSGVLAMGVARQKQASDRMADQRLANRRAENALLSMQAGMSTSSSDVRIATLGATSPVPGEKWVQVTAPWRFGEATVVGLVPEGSAQP